MNDMIYDLRITNKKGNELPVVDNKKPKEQYYQSNDINENVKLQKEGNVGESQLKSITILLFPSSRLGDGRHDNFEINISFNILNNPQIKGLRIF
ncbi:MAG TPA: hypothetical protein VJ697_12595 [Nitrososphaeraceae archaeon]|nr:hypothetical protein [Nitrososphaeraceae archaeon]